MRSLRPVQFLKAARTFPAHPDPENYASPWSESEVSKGINFLVAADKRRHKKIADIYERVTGAPVWRKDDYNIYVKR